MQDPAGGAPHAPEWTREAILAYRLPFAHRFRIAGGSVPFTPQLIYALRFKRFVSRKPAPNISSPSIPTRGRRLAVLGNVAVASSRPAATLGLAVAVGAAATVGTGATVGVGGAGGAAAVVGVTATTVVCAVTVGAVSAAGTAATVGSGATVGAGAVPGATAGGGTTETAGTTASATAGAKVVGVSKTWVTVTVSPPRLTPSIGAVFRVSTDEFARTTEVESTGSPASLASWMAIAFS